MRWPSTRGSRSTALSPSTSCFLGERSTSLLEILEVSVGVLARECLFVDKRRTFRAIFSFVCLALAPRRFVWAIGHGKKLFSFLIALTVRISKYLENSRILFNKILQLQTRAFTHFIFALYAFELAKTREISQVSSPRPINCGARLRSPSLCRSGRCGLSSLNNEREQKQRQQPPPPPPPTTRSISCSAFSRRAPLSRTPTGSHVHRHLRHLLYRQFQG